MPLPEPRTFSIEQFVDARGSLIAAEFPALPFEPRRIFVVTGLDGGSRRGGHVVRCEELLMLVVGAATVAITAENATSPEKIGLSVPGQCILVRPGEYLEYWLRDSGSTIMAFASEAYLPPNEGDVR